MGKMGFNWVKWGYSGLKGSAKQGKTRPNVVNWGKIGPNVAKHGQPNMNKYEDDLKNEDILKNEDNLKNEDDLKMRITTEMKTTSKRKLYNCFVCTV